MWTNLVSFYNLVPIHIFNVSSAYFDILKALIRLGSPSGNQLMLLFLVIQMLIGFTVLKLGALCMVIQSSWVLMLFHGVLRSIPLSLNLVVNLSIEPWLTLQLIFFGLHIYCRNYTFCHQFGQHFNVTITVPYSWLRIRSHISELNKLICIIILYESLLLLVSYTPNLFRPSFRWHTSWWKVFQDRNINSFVPCYDWDHHRFAWGRMLA